MAHATRKFHKLLLGPTSAAIRRRWSAGYHIDKIAEDLEVAIDDVAKVLTQNGVSLVAVNLNIVNRRTRWQRSKQLDA